MSKHTPGPWIITEIGTIEDDSHNPVQICAISPRNREANARLIADAPEMYDLLKDLLPKLAAHGMRTDEVRAILARIDSPETV